MDQQFIDYLVRQAALTQARYDATYADDLRRFNEGCEAYPSRAQHQYDIDGTILAPPTVPVKKTCAEVNGILVEGTWVDPNLHSPVFSPQVVPVPTGMPDISQATTLDQIATRLDQLGGMLVLLANKLDAITGAMKIPLLLLACGLLVVGMGMAADQHSATIAWQDSANPVGTTYIVLGASGSCTTTTTFSMLASGVMSKTYKDTPLPPGPRCYAVKASYLGKESAPSDSVTGSVPAFPPSELTVTGRVLTWVASPDGGTHSVYRASGLCSGITAATKIATGLSALTYTDVVLPAGDYCYGVTVTVNGVESPPSNTVQVSIAAAAPTQVTVQVQ